MKNTSLEGPAGHVKNPLFWQLLFHATSMVPSGATAICSKATPLGKLEMSLGAENVVPPSTERAKNRSKGLCPETAPSHKMLMPPAESATTEGPADAPVPRITGAEKFAPPSEDRANRTWPPLLKFAQETLIFPARSTAISGRCWFSIPPDGAEMFMGVEKVWPPSAERLKKTAV